MTPDQRTARARLTEAEAKVCTKCGQQKSLDAFPFRYKPHGIRHPWCKDCKAAYHLAHYGVDVATYMKRLQHERGA